MTAFYLPLYGVAEFIKIQQQMSFQCFVIFLKFALNDTEMKWLWLTYNEMHAFVTDINSLFAPSAVFSLQFFIKCVYMMKNSGLLYVESKEKSALLPGKATSHIEASVCSQIVSAHKQIHIPFIFAMLFIWILGWNGMLWIVFASQKAFGMKSTQNWIHLIENGRVCVYVSNVWRNIQCPFECRPSV